MLQLSNGTVESYNDKRCRDILLLNFNIEIEYGERNLHSSSWQKTKTRPYITGFYRFNGYLILCYTFQELKEIFNILLVYKIIGY